MSWVLLLFVGSCPEGWISGGYLGSCYRIVHTRVNISTAKAACASIYYKSRLVAIESNAEFDFLRRHYQYLYDNEGEYTKATNVRHLYIFIYILVLYPTTLLRFYIFFSVIWF